MRRASSLQVLLQLGLSDCGYSRNVARLDFATTSETVLPTEKQGKKRPMLRETQNQAGRRFNRLAARRNHGRSMRRKYLGIVACLASMRWAHWRASAGVPRSARKLA